MIEAGRPVGEIAVEKPQAITLFQELGIDFYCRGRRTAKDACEAVGLSVEEVLNAVEGTSPKASNPVHRRWAGAPLRELMQFIGERCHAPNRQKIERITQELRQFPDEVKSRYPWLPRVQMIFASLSREVLPHMSKEEDVIFPLIDALEKGKDPASSARGFIGSLTNQMLLEFHEHDVLSEKLRTIRELTSNYSVPQDTPDDVRELVADLKDFERVLQWHMHLENNILLARAGELEAELFTRPMPATV